MSKFVLDALDGVAVPAHVGLGSASEVGLAITQDQPTEARWHVGEGITQCVVHVCSLSSGMSRQE